MHANSPPRAATPPPYVPDARPTAAAARPSCGLSVVPTSRTSAARVAGLALVTSAKPAWPRPGCRGIARPRAASPARATRQPAHCRWSPRSPAHRDGRAVRMLRMRIMGAATASKPCATIRPGSVSEGASGLRRQNAAPQCQCATQDMHEPAYYANTSAGLSRRNSAPSSAPIAAASLGLPNRLRLSRNEPSSRATSPVMCRRPSGSSRA